MARTHSAEGFEIPVGRKVWLSEDIGVSFRLPVAASDRLDRLVELLEVEVKDRTGEVVKQRTTSRQELVAALICAAPRSRRQLERVLEGYREKRVGQTTIPQTKAGTVSYERPAPGLRLTTDQRSAAEAGRHVHRRNRTSQTRVGRTRLTT